MAIQEYYYFNGVWVYWGSVQFLQIIFCFQMYLTSVNSQLIFFFVYILFKKDTKIKKRWNILKKMNSLKKGEGVPLLNFEGDPGVPLLNFEGGPGSQVPGSQGPGSRGPGPTFTPCRCLTDCKPLWTVLMFSLLNWLQDYLKLYNGFCSSKISFIISGAIPLLTL